MLEAWFSLLLLLSSKSGESVGAPQRSSYRKLRQRKRRRKRRRTT